MLIITFLLFFLVSVLSVYPRTAFSGGYPGEMGLCSVVREL
nr:MAG TPA: hypothetical protein [Bacteriophage sp.]